MKKLITVFSFSLLLTISFACSDETQDNAMTGLSDISPDISTEDSVSDIYKCQGDIKTEPIEITDYKPFVKGPYVMYTDTTSSTIMWQTEKTEPSVADYGENQISLKRISGKEDVLHEIKIEGLKPDTLYYYRVGDGNNMTEFFTFKTSPAISKPFRFAAYSDSQSYPERHSRLIPMIANLGPAFILHAGDAVERGWEEERWQTEVFDVIRPLAFFIPYYFAIGNHEANTDYYYKYLSYPYPDNEPQHESYYWFRYGAVFVIVIDSEKYIFGKDDPQHKWIVKTLEMPEAVWAGLRIAVFHQSAYTDGWGHCDYDGNLQIRSSLIPALEKGGINLILNGHTHGYERGLLNGVYHMIIGGGGGDLDMKCNNFPFIEKTNYVHHFIYGDVLCDKVIIHAIDIDGNLFDEFEIPFDFPKPSK
ncbi:MAG: metallophosphoesterase family protein [Deltaproteobacteria bacterium]|nr:metallophosphoesterase family protein [Deltaproteobacteria bacterium]